jgi:DNA-binding FadR family transcriptional regulator
MMMYERVYQIIKNKIECGLLPVGSSLPSRSNLCEEFGTSEKTIRRALKLLEDNGLIETQQRVRPVVRYTLYRDTHISTLEPDKIDTTITRDVLKAGAILCYPLIQNGISLCCKEDLKIPHRIMDNMSIENADEFWKLSKLFWRFFVARNENDLSFRVARNMGLSDIRPLRDGIESRTRYYQQLQEFMGVIENGGKRSF